jgi:ribose 5-phosphate isomerase A
MTTSDMEAYKRVAAEAAAREVRDGMRLGLGTGSTVAHLLPALAARGLRGLRCVATSVSTEQKARELGLPVEPFDALDRLDLAIDGADQIARGALDLVKGLGGALLREKMVALASTRMIVVADESKLVDKLGGATPLPVEIVSFGWELTLDRLKALGATPRLRYARDKPFVTDNGNYIADCGFTAIPDPTELDLSLRSLFGVVATGLFCGLASTAIIGTAQGVAVLNRELAL